MPVGQNQQGFRLEAMNFSRSRQRNQWFAHIELLSRADNALVQAFFACLCVDYAGQRLTLVVELALFLAELKLALFNLVKLSAVIGQLIDAYDKYGVGCVGVKEVPRKDVPKYCSLDVTPIDNNVMAVHNIIEKPTPEEIVSCYSILGRVVMPPEIFDLIEQTPPDKKSGEVYFTDSMLMLARQVKLNAVDFDGIRYDMGNKLGIMKANCEVALNHDEIGEDFKAYLKELVKTF